MKIVAKKDYQDYMKYLNQVKTSTEPEVEKISKIFDWITLRIIQNGEREIELAKAMNDKETQIKEQIKVNMIRNARDIFSESFLQVTGRSVLK